MQRIDTNVAIVRGKIAAACLRAGRDPEDVKLVAVTKGVSAELIREAYDSSLRDFGENRVQEAEAKRGELQGLTPPPAWHLIGHLQTNKVGAALRLFDIIHSVDSVRLARALSERAGGGTRVLLEVNIAGEATKSGFAPEDVEQAFAEISSLPGLDIRGLMTVAPVMIRPTPPAAVLEWKSRVAWVTKPSSVAVLCSKAGKTMRLSSRTPPTHIGVKSLILMFSVPLEPGWTKWTRVDIVD